ncbi:hypothetical protein FA13DRAFT_1731585 [Coprinellus micaceus]|uniref:Uncharacterized protein n=1 Tax=Coprinellus micaceus TaxID=71717 RepID=A0A4Y7TDY3_COPMI|nr:hypothetical protein FA13DRAFT_1731585 [Coprinellus micaceus]
MVDNQNRFESGEEGRTNRERTAPRSTSRDPELGSIRPKLYEIGHDSCCLLTYCLIIRTRMRSTLRCAALLLLTRRYKRGRGSRLVTWVWKQAGSDVVHGDSSE